MNKIKLLEKVIKENGCIWFDGKTIFSKWDDQVNWIEGYSREEQKYIRSLFKKANKSEGLK